ncbi:nucleoside hydrolase [Seminavis robusta]|uniref:Nucleoside hydrolase n=1 Tax=Seminavis robusta TaxID=568900 RepID=A0A9N8DYA7_9STRA|nr:nucleoside hydrolase [Seminavis robusta]|eukprot:Sro374_g129150.1 nucleoside hydrolase (241) ;mRNA; r:2964-3686
MESAHPKGHRRARAMRRRGPLRYLLYSWPLRQCLPPFGGGTMTALFVQERNSNRSAPDTKIRSHGTLGIAAISHINVVVNDSIDIGAQYYEEILGFKPAYNADGKMEYRNITNYGFCLDAGFEQGDCRVDIIFLKHEVLNLYLGLFYYYSPFQGNLQLPYFETNDVGGVRHIAVELQDAVKTYHQLKAMNHQGRFVTQDAPVPLDPFPYTFFYWVDKYRIQWEFEQGRPVVYYHIAGITG